jgi:hypothetical protein
LRFVKSTNGYVNLTELKNKGRALNSAFICSSFYTSYCLMAAMG